MAEEILSTLRNLAREKKDCLEEILLISQHQITAIENEELETLETLLDKKDSMIEKINSIESDFRSRKSEQAIEIKDEELSKILSDIQKTLNKIKILDDMNNKKLQSAIDDMKNNLKQVRQGKRAMNNYGNSDPYQAFASQGGTLFIDQDS